MVIIMRRNWLLLFLAGSLALATGHAQITAPPPGAPAADVKVGANGPPLSTVATAMLNTGGESHWTGEVFPLTYEVTVSRHFFQSLAEGFQWDSTPLVTEEWSSPEASDSVVGADARAVYTRRNRAYSSVAKALTLAPASQPVNLVTGSSGTGAFAQNNSIDEFSVKSPPASLEIRPLPSPAPEGFVSAVGDFALKASVSPAKAKVGESIAWVLELSGSGNWPEIRGFPSRSLAKEFHVIALPLDRKFKADVLFEGSVRETLVIVPTKEGSYALPGVTFVYFDPKAGQYKTLTSEALTLSVAPGAPGVAAALALTPGAAAGPVKPASHATRIPESPPLLPLDPMGSSGHGMGPFSRRTLEAEVAAPLVLLLVFWLALAARQRRLTDPLRPRRLARAGMAAALRKLEPPASSVPRPVLLSNLLLWQQSAARFWEVPHKSPTPRDLSRTSAGPAWIQLWRESDRVLFSENATLAPDWVEKAGNALKDARLPRLSLVAIFLPRNLLPFAALVVLLWPRLALGDVGTDAYNSGRFPDAQKAWQQAVTAHPNDAYARYNLALAYSQQNHWTESAAQSLAAFCLDPRDPAIRWQFAMSMERAAIDQPVITAFAHRDRLHEWISVLSPGGWSVMLGLATTVASLAAAWFLWLCYVRPGSSWRWAAILLGLAAVCVVIGGVISLKKYGPLAKHSTAVVIKATTLYSVPTEATSLQRTAALPAGTMAVVDRLFLGWSRLVFPNGQTGWVRTDVLTHLYE